MRNHDTDSGRFSYDGLDRVIHEKARLGILTSLATHADGLLFPELKALCSLTDGNLNRHLQVLREAKLIETWKRGEGKKSQTLVRMTVDGRQQYFAYLEVLESVVADAADAVAERVPQQSLKRDGWSPA
jgi:DNA-binding transcriptional ArsR family regulator